jgi:hypothetical protein
MNNRNTEINLCYNKLNEIFGPKRDEVTGEWRKLHIEELHDMYSSPSIIRKIKVRRMRRDINQKLTLMTMDPLLLGY